MIADNTDSDIVKDATLTFGTGTTTFLANNGTWQTPAPIYYARLLSPVTTDSGSTTAKQVFSFSLVAGTYDFETIGTISKTGGQGAASRAYQVMFTCDSTTGYSNILAHAIFSPNGAFTANTGNAMSVRNSTIISVVSSSIAGTSGTLFQGTTNTTAVSNMPFEVHGRITLTSTRTFRVHIRQTSAAIFDTVSVNDRTYIRVTKVA